MLFICCTQGLGVTKPEKHDHTLSQQNRYFLEKFFEQIIMVSQNGALCASVSRGPCEWPTWLLLGKTLIHTRKLSDPGTMPSKLMFRSNVLY